MDELKRDLCLGVVGGLAISEKAALKAFLVLVVQYRELGHLYNNNQYDTIIIFFVSIPHVS